MLAQEHILNNLFNGISLPLVMGILNVTPDSFSDGSKYLQFDQAVEKAKQIISEGADIIDIGGESTRPGSESTPLVEELQRVIPVIKEIRKFSDIPVSIDTRKAEVARQAIQAGAEIVNDISALRNDPDMISVLSANHNVGLILMHMQGEPSTMQSNPHYEDVITEIMDFFNKRITFCEQNKVSSNRLILDPGIGFGKLKEHNLQILSNLIDFHKMGLPLAIGASRKRFIYEISPSTPDERLAGSLAAVNSCLEAKVEIIRVHDVKEHVQYIKVLKAIKAVKKQ